MKTKEEIINQVVFEDDERIESIVYKSDAIKAMDEYAQQQSIMFLEFAMKTCIWGDIDGRPFIRPVQWPEINTAQDAYTQFIESQNR